MPKKTLDTHLLQFSTQFLHSEISIEFHLYGDIDEDKAIKAAELSIGKYCSVSATLEKAGAKVSYKVFVHPA